MKKWIQPARKAKRWTQPLRRGRIPEKREVKAMPHSC
jgi:hypothetical protein